jgi:hypothetical protein
MQSLFLTALFWLQSYVNFLKYANSQLHKVGGYIDYNQIPPPILATYVANLARNAELLLSLQKDLGVIKMSSIVLFIFLLSIGASFVQRTTGFGFGIFIMTMLPFFLPTYGEATTLSGLLAITTSAVIVWKLRGFITWKRLWPILLTFIIVSTIAIFALTRIEDHILRQILGVALILISIYFAAFSQRIKLPTTKRVQVGAGTLSGLMGGFFGMQGPPAVLYFIQSEPTKEHYMAMAQTYFLIGNVMMTIVRAYNGFLTTTVLTDYCFGLGGVIIGTSLGTYVFKRIPNRIFRYIVYAYIGISGLIILLTN